jgi:hypothetical protein
LPWAELTHRMLGKHVLQLTGVSRLPALIALLGCYRPPRFHVYSAGKDEQGVNAFTSRAALIPRGQGVLDCGDPRPASVA